MSTHQFNDTLTADAVFFHVFFCLCMEFFRFIEFKQLCSPVQESIDKLIIWFRLQFCHFDELNWYYCDLIMIARNVLGRGVKSLKYSFDFPNNGRIVFFFHSSYRYVILIYHKMFWSWPWEQNRIVIIRAHLEINFSQIMDVLLLFFCTFHMSNYEQNLSVIKISIAREVEECGVCVCDETDNGLVSRTHTLRIFDVHYSTLFALWMVIAWCFTSSTFSIFCLFVFLE